MKKLLISFITLFLMLSMVACTDSGDDATTAATTATTGITNDTTASDPTTIPNTATTAAVNTTQVAAVPTKAEVIIAYKKAFKIYEACYILGFESEGGTPILSDNVEWYKVRDYHTFQELRTYMETVLSINLVDNLLPGQLKEFNGVLYGCEIIFPIEGFGQETVAVVRNSDSQFTVTATVELIDIDSEAVSGYQNYDSIYNKVDGKWVFTSFNCYFK